MLPYIIGQPIYYRLWHISGTVVLPKGHFIILVIIDCLLEFPFFIYFFHSGNLQIELETYFEWKLGRPKSLFPVPIIVSTDGIFTPRWTSQCCNFMICNYAYERTH